MTSFKTLFKGKVKGHKVRTKSRRLCPSDVTLSCVTTTNDVPHATSQHACSNSGNSLLYSIGLQLICITIYSTHVCHNVMNNQPGPSALALLTDRIH